MTAEPIVKQASSILEVCQRYGLGRQTVYNEINRGNLRIHKIGKRTIILAADEEAWLATMKTLLAQAPAHARQVVARRRKRTRTDKTATKRLKAQSVS